MLFKRGTSEAPISTDSTCTHYQNRKKILHNGHFAKLFRDAFKAKIKVKKALALAGEGMFFLLKASFSTLHSC
jgi:hypothetical protein